MTLSEFVNKYDGSDKWDIETILLDAETIEDDPDLSNLAASVLDCIQGFKNTLDDEYGIDL